MPDDIIDQIDQRDGFPGGAVKCARIDDAKPADTVICGNMRVAEEEIVVSGIFGHGVADELGAIAMGDGDLLAGELKLGEIPAALQAKLDGVSSEKARS